MKTRFKLIERFFNDCALIKMSKIKDERGYFVRLFCLEEINKILKKKNLKLFNQPNHFQN